jgi:Tol biopolymer transport system component
VLHRHEGTTGGDNWILDIEQNRMQRLTFDASQDNSSPIWSPDGTKIAYVSNRNNKWGIFIKPADGTGAEELIIESEAPKSTMAWSPDGKLLVYRQTGQAGDLWAVPVAGDRKPIALAVAEFNEDYPSISPDGKWMAYTSNETGRAQVYIKSFPEGPGKWQVSTDGGQWPRWRGDGKELYFNSGSPPWMAAAIKVTGTSLQAGVPEQIFVSDNPNIQQPHNPYLRYAVSADGTRFYFSQPGTGTGLAAAGGSSGISAQLAAAADGQSSVTPGNGNVQKVSVILNFPQMIKK